MNEISLNEFVLIKLKNLAPSFSLSVDEIWSFGILIIINFISGFKSKLKKSLNFAILSLLSFIDFLIRLENFFKKLLSSSFKSRFEFTNNTMVFCLFKFNFLLWIFTVSTHSIRWLII